MQFAARRLFCIVLTYLCWRFKNICWRRIHRSSQKKIFPASLVLRASITTSLLDLLIRASPGERFATQLCLQRRFNRINRRSISISTTTTTVVTRPAIYRPICKSILADVHIGRSSLAQTWPKETWMNDDWSSQWVTVSCRWNRQPLKICHNRCTSAWYGMECMPRYVRRFEKLTSFQRHYVVGSVARNRPALIMNIYFHSRQNVSDKLVPWFLNNTRFFRKETCFRWFLPI